LYPVLAIVDVQLKLISIQIKPKIYIKFGIFVIFRAIHWSSDEDQNVSPGGGGMDGVGLAA